MGLRRRSRSSSENHWKAPMVIPAIDVLVTTVTSSTTVQAALAALIAAGVKDISAPAYAKVKTAIQDKFRERKYAFVPKKEEAIVLLRLEQDPSYKQVTMLIPDYEHL